MGTQGTERSVQQWDKPMMERVGIEEQKEWKREKGKIIQLGKVVQDLGLMWQSWGYLERNSPFSSSTFPASLGNFFPPCTNCA